MKKAYIFSVLSIALLFGACKKDDDQSPEPTPTLEVPTSYVSTNYATNASSEIALVTSLVDLTNEAKTGRTLSTTVDAVDLQTLFEAGDPSLQDKITTYYKGKLEGTNGWFDELEKASGGSYTPGAPTGNGGVYGTGTSAYLFDENGLEMEQLIEKGQFGATLFNAFAEVLSTSPLNSADVDRAIALFGATPSFSNSGSNNVAAEVRDRAMANYAARRDKNDGNGLYAQMKYQFIRLKAAIEAGSAFDADRDDAIRQLKLLWEKVNAATVINYCHSATSTLSNDPSSLTDNQKAGALHALSEGVGFIHGLRTISQNHKKITDAEIEAVLVLLNAPYNGTATSYTFVTDATNELDQLTEAIEYLQDVYGFSDQEIEDFKSNWVSVQGR
jgi:hypothetical protein